MGLGDCYICFSQRLTTISCKVLCTVSLSLRTSCIGYLNISSKVGVGVVVSMPVTTEGTREDFSLGYHLSSEILFGTTPIVLAEGMRFLSSDAFFVLSCYKSYFSTYGPCLGFCRYILFLANKVSRLSVLLSLISVATGSSGEGVVGFLI